MAGENFYDKRARFYCEWSGFHDDESVFSVIISLSGVKDFHNDVSQATHYVNPTLSFGCILVTYVSYFLVTLIVRKPNYGRSSNVVITLLS